MAGGTGKLLGDVRAVGEEGDLLHEAFVIERQRQAGILQTLAEELALRFRHGGGFFANGGQQAFDAAQAGFHLLAEVIAFGFAHGIHLLQRGGDSFFNERPSLLGGGFRLLEAHNAWQAHQIMQRDLRRDLQLQRQPVQRLVILLRKNVIDIHGIGGALGERFGAHGDIHPTSRDASGHQIAHLAFEFRKLPRQAYGRFELLAVHRGALRRPSHAITPCLAPAKSSHAFHPGR